MLVCPPNELLIYPCQNSNREIHETIPYCLIAIAMAHGSKKLWCGPSLPSSRLTRDARSGNSRMVEHDVSCTRFRDQGSFAITYSRPFIYLRSTRCGSRNKPTNAEQIRVARGDTTHAPQMLLYPVPPRCFCEECLKDVYLEPVRASTTGEIDIKRTYTAMAMTASVSNTAYQKRRLRG
jgi:hypothetical protein